MWLNWGLYVLIYWDFDCTGKCGMHHYYASFREFESNFRPARVFHSACAVTSYYAYLKQRMKTLFQISSLWATPHMLYTPSYTLPSQKTTDQHTDALSLSRHFLTDTAHSLCLIYWVKSHFVYNTKIMWRQKRSRQSDSKNNMSWCKELQNLKEKIMQIWLKWCNYSCIWQ